MSAPLVMLHGWAMHSGVWRELAERLGRRREVIVIDLPGHGERPYHPFDLVRLADQLAAEVDLRADWLGWSLGGSVALALAVRHPERVRRLLLTAATPRFVTGAGWPHGLDREVLDHFAAGIRDDYDATLRRFLFLQTRGGHDARALQRTLCARLADHRPLPQALDDGLAILRDSDLRPQLARIDAPALWLHGERDTLTPAAAAVEAAASMPNAACRLLSGAAHAPFLSHPDDFVAAAEEFLHG